MSAVSFARETIERLRYPLIDDQGTMVPDYSAAPAVLHIPRCWLVPITSTDNEDGRLAVFTGFDCVGPWGADIVFTDHVRYFGIEYEVAGDVMPVRSPTGALNETKFALRRWHHVD